MATTKQTALDRFSDLNKQGFMKNVYKKAKVVTVFEAWTPDGVTYSGADEFEANRHVLKYGGEVRKVRR